MSYSLVIIHGRYIVYKTKDTYEDIADDVNEKINTSSYGIKESLLNGLNKKVTEIIKDELSRKLMTKFVWPRPKIYSYNMCYIVTICFIQLNIEMYVKGYIFFAINIGKHLSVKLSTVKKLLIVPKKLLKMHLKLLQKELLKKQLKQLVILLVIKLLIKSQTFQKLYHEVV